jgi:peptide deformylase
MVMASPYTIRLFGDPVLRTVAEAITNIDGKLAQLADEMLETMYAEPGLGLAAPQVGVQRRLFVYDIGEGPQTLVNPVISESRGEWSFEEGCLSVPGLWWEIVRPKEIHLTGYDLDGNEISIEADELLGRLFQHELDHLDGVLLLDRLDADTRKQAMKTVRELFIDGDPAEVRATAEKNRADRSAARSVAAQAAPPRSKGLTLP